MAEEVKPIQSGAGVLGARYHEILAYRTEGLRKYGGRVTSDIYGPRWRVSFPTVTLAPPPMPFVKIGPLYFGDNPPILGVLRKCIASFRKPVRILEIGPGTGSAAGSLRKTFGNRIAAYYGIERDESIAGPYERIASVEELDTDVDVLVASHVVEHMPAEAFFVELLGSLTGKLTPDAAAVIATPNALAPGAIFSDFTHVQGYAWYDLYALLRLWFERVDVVRARYLWSPARVFWLVPRVLVARSQELDWCDEVFCVARGPRRDVKN